MNEMTWDPLHEQIEDQGLISATKKRAIKNSCL